LLHPTAVHNNAGMATTSTRQIRFDRLKLKGNDAVVVVKLMMACNDLSLANQALEDWKTTTDRQRRDRKRGAGMYFVRVELAHLHEAMRTIKEVDQTPSLRALVDRCDGRTRDSFAEVLSHAHGGAKYGRFAQLIGQLRHNLTFHYYQCDKLVMDAIDDRAGRAEANLSTITRAGTAHRWRFDVADDIVDSIVVRQLWKIPRDADVREEADKIADEVHAILLRFLDFCGEFIWKFCDD
jgi:hypothetical protein